MITRIDHIVFDWGDRIMKDDPMRTDAMYLWPSVELVEGAADALARLGVRPGHEAVCARGFPL